VAKSLRRRVRSWASRGLAALVVATAALAGTFAGLATEEPAPQPWGPEQLVVNPDARDQARKESSSRIMAVPRSRSTIER
jgi:hypothetical protein